MRKVSPMKRVAVLLIFLSIFPLVSFSGERQPVKPSPKDKCPACGMFVAKYPKEADAREFLKDHKGKMLLRFQEITLDGVRGLD